MEVAGDPSARTAKAIKRPLPRRPASISQRCAEVNYANARPLFNTDTRKKLEEMPEAHALEVLTEAKDAEDSDLARMFVDFKCEELLGWTHTYFITFFIFPTSSLLSSISSLSPPKSPLLLS